MNLEKVILMDFWFQVNMQKSGFSPLQLDPYKMLNWKYFSVTLSLTTKLKKWRKFGFLDTCKFKGNNKFRFIIEIDSCHFKISESSKSVRLILSNSILVHYPSEKKKKKSIFRRTSKRELVRESEENCLNPFEILSSRAFCAQCRREVTGSISGRACWPSRSEFSMIFTETRVNTGQDPLGKLPRRAFHIWSQVPRMTFGLKIYNQSTNQNNFLKSA